MNAYLVFRDSDGRFLVATEVLPPSQADSEYTLTTLRNLTVMFDDDVSRIDFLVNLDGLSNFQTATTMITAERDASRDTELWSFKCMAHENDVFPDANLMIAGDAAIAGFNLLTVDATLELMQRKVS